MTAANLTSTERIGQATETYTIWFSAGSKQYDLQTTDYALYQQAVPGSEWSLQVNKLGAVTAATPGIRAPLHLKNKKPAVGGFFISHYFSDTRELIPNARRL